MPHRRAVRVGDLLKKELSDIIRNEMRDPRIGFVTIMGVDVSDDLRFARIYVSVLGTEHEKNQCMEGLHRATGYIRSQVGRRIRMRYIPELSFRYDHSTDHAARITEVMKQIEPILEKTDKPDTGSSAGASGEDADHA